MAILKAFKKALLLPFKPFTLQAKLALKLITPKLPKLPSAVDAEQVISLAAQNNVAKLGEPKTILYGRNVGYYPALIQQPWAEFVNNTQLLHLRLHVSVGICSMESLQIGKTPIAAFPGTEAVLLLPGEPNPLFHSNVYVAELANGIELVVGILVTRSYTDAITFTGNRLRVPNDAASIAARAAAGVDPFFGAAVGNNLIVSGTALNDGAYSITGIDGSAPRDFLDADTTFDDETVQATISWGSYVESGTQYPAVAGVTVTFSGPLSSAKADPLSGNATPLDIFLPGDLMTFTLSAAGANRYLAFTVLAVDDDGALILDPPPTTLGPVVVNAVLLRRYFGPFPVCPPGDTVDRVAFDLLWPQGIGSKGGTRDITMRFDAQRQAIDDAGTPTGGWLSFSTIEVTAQSRNPYRRSFEFAVTPGRYQVRLAQVSIDSSDAAIIDTVQWVGARGYVVPRDGERPDVDADSTTLAVTLRASNAIGSADDQKINGTFQRWLQPFDAGTGFGAEAPSRSIALAALDKLCGRFTAGSRAVPIAEIDTAAFLALDEVLTERGDEFNGQISVSSNLLDSVNTILQLGRAEVAYRWQDGSISVYRDAPTAPVMLFTDLDSDVSGYTVRARTDNDATGLQVSYLEPAFADEGIIGIGDTDAKPIKLDLRNGCISRQRAWEAANYAWGVERYRNRTFKLAAELEPLSLHLGDRILVQNTQRGWGQGAEVVSRVGRLLTVHPPLVWATDASHQVRLRGPDGAPGDPIDCARGAADDQLLLMADPDVEITGDATGEQRTHLAFYTAAGAPRVAIVRGIQWAEAAGAGQRSTLDCVIDDDRIHADPGTAPVDPFAPVINPPSLTIVGLDATDNADGTVSVAWDAVASATLYELQWRYAGALAWTTARRGIGTAATFSVPTSGMIEIRVRAFGGGRIGAYAQTSLTVIISSGGGSGAALAVSISPSNVYGYTTGSLATTDLCSGSATGGTPPYSYLWQLLTSTGGLVLIGNATASATRFSAPGLTAGQIRRGTARLRVTDAASTVVFSGEVDIKLEQYSTGGTPGGQRSD